MSLGWWYGSVFQAKAASCDETWVVSVTVCLESGKPDCSTALRIPFVLRQTRGEMPHPWLSTWLTGGGGS